MRRFNAPNIPNIPPSNLPPIPAEIINFVPLSAGRYHKFLVQISGA